LFIHLHIKGYLGCLKILAVVYKAAMFIFNFLCGHVFLSLPPFPWLYWKKNKEKRKKEKSD